MYCNVFYSISLLKNAGHYSLNFMWHQTATSYSLESTQVNAMPGLVRMLDELTTRNFSSSKILSVSEKFLFSTANKAVLACQRFSFQKNSWPLSESILKSKR